VSDSATPQPPLPSGPRRAAAGAWHVPAGLVFLIRRPRLWPLAALPAVLAPVLLALGLILGWFVFNAVDRRMAGAFGGPSSWSGVIFTVLLGAGVIAAGAVVGVGAALLVSAPLLERLSRHVETLARGEAVDRGSGLRWEVLQSLRSSLYFLVAAPGVLLLSLIPIVGPVLGLLWGAHALSLQQTDAALARRGLDFAARRAWHRRWRPESLGFGIAGLTPLLLPLANIVLAPLLAPALIAGGTLLVMELEQLAPSSGAVGEAGTP